MLSVHEFLKIVDEGGRKVFQCACGRVLGPAEENFKKYTLMAEGPVSEAGPYVNPYKVGGERFVFRRFYCPDCLRCLETEIALKGEPILWDAQVAF